MKLIIVPYGTHFAHVTFANVEPLICGMLLYSSATKVVTDRNGELRVYKMKGW